MIDGMHGVIMSSASAHLVLTMATGYNQNPYKTRNYLIFR